MNHNYRIIVSLFVFSLIVIGWGYRAHKLINENAPSFLPPEMGEFIQQTSFLSQHASDADNRKNNDPNESPKHFIDIDDYQEFFDGTFPQQYNDALQMYGANRLVSNGLLPWVIDYTVDSVAQCLRKNDWQRAFFHAADLGHYVGDLSMPLHVTKNYDGQLTNNSGIHSRYESKMIDKYYQEITFIPKQVHTIDNILDSVFIKINRGWQLHKKILDADNEVIAVTGKNNYNDLYYSLLWNKTSNLTTHQIQDAAQFFAELLYTAWTRAGRPHITNSVQSAFQKIFPETISLGEIYPQPIKNNFIIPLTIQRTTFLEFSLFDFHGKKISHITSDYFEKGIHNIHCDASLFSNGFYLMLVNTRNESHARPILIIQ